MLARQNSSDLTILQSQFSSILSHELQLLYITLGTATYHKLDVWNTIIGRSNADQLVLKRQLSCQPIRVKIHQLEDKEPRQIASPEFMAQLYMKRGANIICGQCRYVHKMMYSSNACQNRGVEYHKKQIECQQITCHCPMNILVPEITALAHRNQPIPPQCGDKTLI